jgi:hypothetical protein
MSDKNEKPLYPYPYKGKPRFLLEGLLRDDGSQSTTTTNVQIMTRNSELAQFHLNAFAKTSPTKITSSPSPLTSPSSFCSSVASKESKMASTDLEIATQKVLRQCQYLICYLCYEVLFCRKSMTKKKMIDAMYENYHGDEKKTHVIPHAYYFTQAFGKFRAAMERSDVDNHDRLINEVTKEKDHTFIVNEVSIPGEDKVITLSMLKRKSINSKEVFSARSIQTYAETAMRNCKCAATIRLEQTRLL